MYRDAYLETEILTASPVRLVELLYRGAIEAVQRALAALEGGDIAGRSRQIGRARGILSELALTLDHERGGAISRELAELYDYMLRRLNEANARQAAPPLREVERLLESLADAWRGVSAAFAAGSEAMGYEGAGEQVGVHFEEARVDQRG